jgi:hypothetical protein
VSGTSTATTTFATTTTFDTTGLTAQQIGTWKLRAPSAAALLALAKERGLPPVHVISGAPGPHVEVGPVAEKPISLVTRRLLDSELAVARAAAARLATTAAAAAAGYVRSAPFAPGDGVHWTRWDLVAKPFDPANPAMLLFSSTNADAHLIAFSYYVRNRGLPPQGFHGPNDIWHRHSGLCIRAGASVAEAVAATTCDGIWLNGSDLWMLHAWIVPGEANPWGVFAPINQKWCLDIPGCGDNPLPEGAKP